MNRDTKIIAGVIVAALAGCCCLALALFGLGGFFLFEAGRTVATEIAPLLTEVFITPVPDTPTPRPEIVLTPVPTPLAGAEDTLQALEEADIPPSDLRELAMRLQGIPDIPEVVSTTPTDYPIGHELQFNVFNDDTHENFVITARLVYKTENAYFFAENGVDANPAEVKRLLDTFQNEIYPTNRQFFGEEWNPGVDGDPHLYILYTRGLGANVGGYYSSSDEYSRLAHEFSNEKEMFYASAAGVSPGDEYMYSTLAHEFQHMIHWYQDRNEETWMNEGASVLAEVLNGYSPSGSQFGFVAQADLQLTDWVTSDHPDFGAHYGAAFMFMAYFFDRFGSEATQALVAHSSNGLRAVDETLAELGLTGSAAGRPLTSEEVFADWAVANYLNDPGVGDGRYAYRTYENAPTVPAPTDSFFTCLVEQSATVRQYATDYYEINCDGPVTITFTGSQQVRAIPSDPRGGRYAMWGTRNDESATSLTREFDLSNLTAATLKYWMWAQIEKDFDYAYVEVSTDGGETWTILRTPSGTDEDPIGANLGWGYTGASGGGNPEEGDPSQWIEETVDLSEYSGQTILVRFEYVTDLALTYGGFMLDDISVPELNYAADFEKDDGGWEARGFVRMDNRLPQRFVVQVIRQGRTGAETTVERLPLDANNTGSLTLDLGRNEKAVLVVSGVTPYTTEVASYQFEVQ
ncbi:MAG: hypothetical protein ACRDH2_03725 [Anaerolineales bacterium]